MSKEQWWENLLIGEPPKENRGKSKDMRQNTPYLIHGTFFPQYLFDRLILYYQLENQFNRISQLKSDSHFPKKFVFSLLQ